MSSGGEVPRARPQIHPRGDPAGGWGSFGGSFEEYAVQTLWLGRHKTERVPQGDLVERPGTRDPTRTRRAGKTRRRREGLRIAQISAVSPSGTSWSWATLRRARDRRPGS